MDEQSKEHGAAGRHLSVALSSEALYGKSQVYVQRALEAKDSKDQEVYQIWAALALELLAKASLAKIHPCLVVEVANPNSLLEACGIHTDTAVRTVDANIVFARLKHTVPNFGTPNAEACKKISARRNAELHSGQAAFASVPPEASEGEFWSAAQLILSAMGLTLDDWVGVASRTPMKLLRHLGMLKRKAARQRISDASQIFALNPEGKKRPRRSWRSFWTPPRSFTGTTTAKSFGITLITTGIKPALPAEARDFLQVTELGMKLSTKITPRATRQLSSITAPWSSTVLLANST